MGTSGTDGRDRTRGARPHVARADGRPQDRRSDDRRRTEARRPEPRREEAPLRRPAARRTAPPRRPRPSGRKLRLGDGERRLRILLLGFAIVLSLFLGRLVQLQGIDASVYATAAAQDRLRERVLPATRGTISDAHGIALATTIAAVNVTVDQKVVGEAEKQSPESIAAQLSPLLGIDEATLVERLTGERRFAYVAKDVDVETWRAITELEPRPVGIYSERIGRRTYPGGTLAANVLGFLGKDGAPLGGVELALDEQLRGKDGRERYEQAAGGRQIPLGERLTEPPVQGRDVQLTINRDIQWYAEQQLARRVEEVGAESGVAVVLDPRTGAVLAMAVAPSFDANEPAAADEKNRGNRALQEAYEPGSTGKILTAAALIEEDVVTPTTVLTVPNRLLRAGKNFKDWEDHETQQLTFAGTLARSSNIGTILAAERLGLEELHPYFEKFGIGEPLGLGLPEHPGILPHPDGWSATTGYTLAFGQGYSVNALQMASAIGAVANEGVRVQPRLVSAFVDEDGTRHPVEEGEQTRVVSPETARTVMEMLEGITQEGGTAPATKIPGYRVAGKTGTANRFVESCGGYCGYTMSFIGIAPADDPQLVVAVTLQDAKGTGGGSTAGPVFRDVMSFALKTLRIPPTGAAAPEIKIFAE